MLSFERSSTANYRDTATGAVATCHWRKLRHTEHESKPTRTSAKPAWHARITPAFPIREQLELLVAFEVKPNSVELHLRIPYLCSKRVVEIESA